VFLSLPHSLAQTAWRSHSVHRESLRSDATAPSHASESHGSGPGPHARPPRNLTPSPRAWLLPFVIIFRGVCAREHVPFKQFVVHMYFETASIQYMCWNKRQFQFPPKFCITNSFLSGPDMTLVPIPELIESYPGS